MTDDTNALPPDSDDLVGQVVERAATKVADAAIAPAAGRLDRWIYVGVFGVATLLVAAIANLVLNVQTKNAVEKNERKIEALCKIASLSQGAQDAPQLPLRLAECIE
jgi:hypothetical protein